MTTLVALALGCGAGVGIVLVAFGLLGRTVMSSSRSGKIGKTASRPRIAVVFAAVVAGLAAYGITGWLVGGIMAALVAVVAPRMAGGSSRYRAEIAKVEGIASWAEMLRDTMAAASGLEQAIVATGPIAPSAIGVPVAALAGRLGFDSLPASLRRFAADVDHPTADFVVAGLVIAAEKDARDLGPLLGQLAECARDEARMRSRIWIDRARMRTSVRVIAVCVLLFAAGLMVLDRGYLRPYDTSLGQGVLVVVGAIFASSFIAMDRMGRIAMPERFIARRDDVVR